MSTGEILPGAETIVCRPWPRLILPRAAWQAFVAPRPDPPPTPGTGDGAAPGTGDANAAVPPPAIADRTAMAGRHDDERPRPAATMLLALWADTMQVHALFLDPAALQVTAVSTPVEAGRYPALSPTHPAAALFERMIADLWGHEAEGGADPRPWLDHGHWPQSQPMAARPVPARLPDDDAALLEPDQALTQRDLGPVHGRLDEAARLHLRLSGGAIAAAEARLGFTHKGTLTLMRGKSPRTAARFAARLSGDATVAHALAFARAAEAALGVEVPPRAAALRHAMLEIERVACHLDTLAETARLAGADTVWTGCGALREHLLRATAAAFGHRLMMDCVVPGGVALDIAEPGIGALLRALDRIGAALPDLRRRHRGSALAARLDGLGCADADLLRACGAGGPAGRAAGHGFDARLLDPGAPLALVTGGRGDALGRQRQRLAEIAVGLAALDPLLRTLPAPPLTVALGQDSGEGIGCAESARGDIWHWLRLDHGQIAACFPRDPGWALWPAAEAALRGAAAEDAGLIRASFALPASGMDL